MNDIDFGEYFYYDETSPSCLRAKVKRLRSKVEVDDVVGWQDSHGYWRVKVGGKPHLIHRIIWVMQGNRDIQVVDHIDGNPTNNKINNLRSIPKRMNWQNKKMQTSCSSGVTGVTWRTRSPTDTRGLRAVAMWTGLDKVQKNRGFLVSKFGLLPAFAMAVALRQQKIRELNEQGAGYTDRHGTLSAGDAFQPENPLASTLLYIECAPAQEMKSIFQPIQNQASQQSLRTA